MVVRKFCDDLLWNQVFKLLLRRHFNFLEQESKTLRIHDIHTLVHKLPEANFEMLDLLIGHLRK